MEANDMKAMREVVEKMCDLFERGVICTSYANTTEEMEQIEELYRKAKAALAKPPRNCDMGTAEEQIARFDAECLAVRKRNTVEPCAGCPCSRDGEGTEDCQLRWAQMPCEEGGAS